MQKGMFLLQVRPVLEKRGEGIMKYHYIFHLNDLRSFSHRGPFFFSQKNTDEQNTQHFTETLSQPITQNVTANVS